MSTTPEPTALLSHTLDSLCQELLRGGVVRAENGKGFQLATPETRSVFNWYDTNRNKWGKPNAREDVEAIAASVDQPVPDRDGTAPATVEP